MHGHESRRRRWIAITIATASPFAILACAESHQSPTTTSGADGGASDVSALPVDGSGRDSTTDALNDSGSTVPEADAEDDAGDDDPCALPRQHLDMLREKVTTCVPNLPVVQCFDWVTDVCCKIPVASLGQETTWFEEAVADYLALGCPTNCGPAPCPSPAPGTCIDKGGGITGKCAP